MKKIYKRLIVFFIGIPALFFLIMYFPHKNHLTFNLIVVLFSLLGAVEFRKFLAVKNLNISIIEAAILGALIPLAMTLVASFGFNPDILALSFFIGASWILASQILLKGEKLDSCVNNVAAGFSVLVYPGLFTGFVIRISVFPNASIFILFFLFMVFINDSFAWLTGMLLGKNNRGIIPVSPNKSIAGFIGGQVFSILTGIGGILLFPEIFLTKFSPILTGAIIGFAMGLAANLGDLSESALKRSSGMKDSGAVILGRGGALDSTDSLIMAAPVYFLLCQVLFML